MEVFLFNLNFKICFFYILIRDKTKISLLSVFIRALQFLSASLKQEEKTRANAMQCCRQRLTIDWSQLAYYWLITRSRELSENARWRWLVRLQAPEKIQFFVWLMFHNSLLTNILRFHRKLTADARCGRCHLAEELDIVHCLRDCPMVSRYGIDWDFEMHASGFNCTDIKEWIISFASADRSTHLFLVALWWIWDNETW